MSEYLDRAKELRAITQIHYNCAQSVAVPFAKTVGIDEDTAYRMAAHFGGGMKMGATCGAVTGAMMVLGLAGKGDLNTLQTLYRAVKEKHDGYLDCRDLLRINAQKGLEKKPHCDAMVYELVQLTEELLMADDTIA